MDSPKACRGQGRPCLKNKGYGLTLISNASCAWIAPKHAEAREGRALRIKGMA